MLVLEDVFGCVALVTSCIGLAPQIYKSAKTKSTLDLSMFMLVNCLICSISWIIYGLYQGATFVIWSNVVCFITSTVSIFQKNFYDRLAKNNHSKQ